MHSDTATPTAGTNRAHQDVLKWLKQGIESLGRASEAPTGTHPTDPLNWADRIHVSTAEFYTEMAAAKLFGEMGGHICDSVPPGSCSVEVRLKD